MKVTEHFRRAKSTLFSIEILPPLKGASIQSIFDGIDPLVEFNPSFIDVTYHREEYIQRKNRKGELKRVKIRKRPGTVGISAAIQARYKIDTVPHMICGGFSLEETENALLDLHFLGINNVLALQGDMIKADGKFIPHPDGHTYANELVEQIVDMNNGRYLDRDLQNVDRTDYCIGVAGYPEKHFACDDFDTDLANLKRKVDAGAEYIVTQMFYDNQKFFNFAVRCRKAGINVPIIPGLKPIATKKQLEVLPRIFYVDIPEDLRKAVEACKDDAAVKQVGVEWAIQQSKELIDFGALCLHFYTMGRSEQTRAIAKAIF
ncbi:MAG: 5,10-methylenetetrahydrofolate reductase [Bacteroidia bacterium]|nr:5,10-methylenetetrahydrofolate reductase [Bacteroidia bacterium]